ncbi:MAG TPA: outer membrane beta-barrel protein [Hyphomicrobium sp.]|nr:outer membrane beta-barrel protein [Hyphomicrobium sp.]
MAGERITGGQASIAALALSAALIASPAFGGDWTQAYIGVGMGADVLTADGQVDLAGGDSVRGSAPVGGDLGLSITAGADYQLNSSFVVGAFVTYDWSNIDTTASITDGFNSASANLLKIDQSWTVGGRFGVLATPSTLIYALLGYTWLELDDMSFSAFGQSASFALPDANGWTVGGGFEHKLSNNVSLRGEYRYTDFGQETLLDVPGLASITGDGSLHVARLVAAYRFGGSQDAPAPETAAPPRNWTGAYFGGGVGVEAFVRDLDVNVPFVGASASLDGLGGGSFGGGLVAGYDVMLTPTVVGGVFGSFDWSNSEFTVSASALGQSVSAEFLSLDRSFTIAGRLGLVIDNDALVYALAGYSRVELNDLTLSGGGASVTLAFPTLDGFTVGGGFERLISDNVSLRAEYRYTMLDDVSIPIVAGLADMDIDSSLHSAKLTATYRFHGGQ